ncbi:anti-anti-sigma factor [Krasilnikovia cinnamomea]|uniref:Anti-sigma factor antagonist n=1 Tax=Krasilnikovia cinnamomea TaxID=349313 RepID=A0A4Q7ZM25_9ACTN|nr:anti-anti-sigma factor [Krasilnikovia cinnamomea]
MGFTARVRHTGTIALITMGGMLDTLSGPDFRREVDLAAQHRVDAVVLDMTDVNYLSSGGLRLIAYLRQKWPSGVKISLVGANEAIQRTIRLVGFHYSLEFGDKLPG